MSLATHCLLRGRAILDNPDLIAACLTGDAESETGPLAAFWYANPLADPATKGVCSLSFIVDDELNENVYLQMINAMNTAYTMITDIQSRARNCLPFLGSQIQEVE
ncbi:MAG: xylulose-5-phosphate/fructose-6-phosphate phosphoketolase [Shewanella sp.]